MYKRNASQDQFSTEIQPALQIKESERISFSKEYSLPEITITDIILP